MRFIKHGAVLFVTGFALTSGTAMVGAHDRSQSRGDDRGSVTVDAPTTRVKTDKDRTRVQVRAPFTGVDVDTKRRRVRIRVPFYDGVVRW